MTAIYYNPVKPTGFWTLDKLAAALPKKNKSDVKAWLEYQDAYTMHRSARRRFLRNPYTVSILMDVLGVWYIGHAIPRKIQWYVQIQSFCNGCFLKISTSGAHKDKERPCSHLGVSILITWWFTPPCVGTYRQGQIISKSTFSEHYTWRGHSVSSLQKSWCKMCFMESLSHNRKSIIIIVHILSLSLPMAQMLRHHIFLTLIDTLITGMCSQAIPRPRRTHQTQTTDS